MSRQDRSRMSMRELIAEAERREIAGAEWMDRAALVRSLEEGDGEGSLGALARARRFFGQVTGLGRVAKVVRSAIDPARPEAPSLATAREAEPVIEEVAPPANETHERAEAPLEATAPRIETPEVAPAPPTETLVPATSELLAGDPAFGGMRVVNRDGRAWLVWRAPGSRLAALVASSTPPHATGYGTVLTLRLVSIGCAIGDPNAEVVVDTADETGLALEGVRALPDVRGRPCVAAIGLGRGDGFVAVAHARVA
jgi:hypothetical protein